MRKLILEDRGTPELYYGVREWTKEEIEERTNATGAYDPDPVYWSKVNNVDDSEAMATLRNIRTGERFFYDYKSQKCYDPQMNELSEEHVNDVVESGLIPTFDINTEDGLRKVIADCENIPEEEVIIVENGGEDGE